MKPLDRFLRSWRISVAMKHIQAGDRVLDIGCGDGALFKQLGARLGHGCGFEPLLGDRVDGLNYELLPGIFPACLGEPGGFDAITMLAVLEHIPLDQQAALVAGCYRHLRPGGVVVITVPSSAVDPILSLLHFLRLIKGMSLEQHYGFQASKTPEIFSPQFGFAPLIHRRFQLGFNNLFVFQKDAR